jgi:hypothetical protein
MKETEATIIIRYSTQISAFSRGSVPFSAPLRLRVNFLPFFSCPLRVLRVLRGEKKSVYSEPGSLRFCGKWR